jgi:hypothetical protein
MGKERNAYNTSIGKFAKAASKKPESGICE